jgi:hypothetical protein
MTDEQESKPAVAALVFLCGIATVATVIYLILNNL